MTLQPSGDSAAPVPCLVSIGNIHATRERIVTPDGTWSLGEVALATHDESETMSRMNGWAIAMLILFIWTFPLNLFFLLWRRRTVSGHINVTVWAPGDRTFTEPVPVWTDVQRRDVFARIAQLQRLVEAGRATGQTGSTIS